MASDIDKIRQYYNDVYYAGAGYNSKTSAHHRKLATRIGILPHHHVLDVACGTGGWLKVAENRGANVAGIDLSEVAVDICRTAIPGADLHVVAAEHLPWDDAQFDIVTCLGSLEHFVDPISALKEMKRVAKQNATFIILVPNSGFLTRRLSLFKGTDQSRVREVVRSLSEWQELFAASGLSVNRRWRDLHVLSWRWITRGRWYIWPLRFTQAIALAVWPLSWQYQVYHQCTVASLSEN